MFASVSGPIAVTNATGLTTRNHGSRLFVRLFVIMHEGARLTSTVLVDSDARQSHGVASECPASAANRVRIDTDWMVRSSLPISAGIARVAFFISLAEAVEKAQGP
jgi:hypothetical protein